MTGEVRVEASPVGPVVRPPGPNELVILYLHGDRYLSGAPESALGLAGRLALRTGAAVVCARYRNAFPDPLLSPLHANLHGLPPVQLLAAGNDVLLDDSLAFAARAARSGVPVDLRVQPNTASLAAETLPAMAAFIAAPPSAGIRSGFEQELA